MSTVPGVQHPKPPVAVGGTHSRRTGLLVLLLVLAVGAGAAVIGILAFGGGGKTSIASRNAAAQPAVAYASGKAFVRALAAGGLPCGGPSIAKLGTGGYEGQQVSCTITTSSLPSASGEGSVTGYVATPTALGHRALQVFMTEFRKATASTAPVGETPLILVGRHWFVNGAESDLIKIQAAIGGRLVKA